MSNWTEPGKPLSHEVLVLIKTDHTGMCVCKNKYLYVLKISPILGHSKNSLESFGHQFSYHFLLVYWVFNFMRISMGRYDI